MSHRARQLSMSLGRRAIGALLVAVLAVGAVWAWGAQQASAVGSATVTFNNNANGGTVLGTMAAQTASTPTALTANAFDKIGSAFVEWNTAIDGLLPIDVLEPAAHNIRIVGTRDLGGVTVDADGNLQLSDSTMSAIQKFDKGTNAVVEMEGAGTSGPHAAVRLIPLMQVIPWWILWVFLGALALFFAVRRWRADSRAAVVALWTVALVGMVGVEIYAWVDMAYVMLPWAPIAAAVVLGLDVFIAIIRRGRRFTKSDERQAWKLREGTSTIYSRA